MRQKHLRLFVGSAIVLMLATGCTTGRNSPKSLETSAGADQSTASALPSASSSASSQQVSVPAYTGEVMDQTHSIAEMDAMPFAQFALLPYADHLAYTVHYGSSDIVNVDPINNEVGYNNPNGIPGLYWDGIDGASFNSTDPLMRSKLITANDYYSTDLSTGTISESLQASVDSTVQNGGSGLADTTKWIKNGSWQEGTNRDGKSIEFIDITTQSIDTHSGKAVGPVITTQTIRQEVKLLDGRTVVAYPRGYGIDGTTSPIPNGTY